MGTTTNYAWEYPDDGGDTDTWGAIHTTMIQAVDATVKANADAASTATSGKLAKASNLADLASLPVALANLGLSGISGGAGWGGNWALVIPVNISGSTVNVLLQGGVIGPITADTTTTLTYPLPFANAVWGVYVSTQEASFASGRDSYCKLIGTPGRTSCTIANQLVNFANATSATWWAVGF